MSKFKRFVELFFFLIGIVLFVLVIRSVEPERLKSILLALSGWGFISFLLYPFMCVWDVYSWKMVFAKKDAEPIKFPEAYLIRLAGEAVNNVTPFLDVGGEPLKAALVSRRFGVTKEKALAASVLGRTALFIAETLFIACGLAVAFFSLKMSAKSKWIFSISTVLTLLFCWVLVWIQKKGFFAKVGGPHIAQFYSEERKRFRAAVLFHFLGWISGSAEMFVFFRMVGAPVTFLNSFLLESLLQLVRTVSFFIPGNLGTQEGGLAFLAQTMGYHPALGVAVSFLKRFRQLVWTGVGFLIWGIYQLTNLKQTVKSHEPEIN